MILLRAEWPPARGRRTSCQPCGRRYLRLHRSLQKRTRSFVYAAEDAISPCAPK
jgi:hypothetical protein